MFGRQRQEQRKTEFKKKLTGEEARKKREENAMTLRKAKRDENLQKKRTVSGVIEKKVYDSSLQQKLEEIPALVNGINSNDSQTQLECTTQFRKLLSIEKNPPIQEVINAGVVPRLVQFLTFTNFPQLQFEAAWALTNIASGSSDQTRVVIEKGAVPIFVQLLASQNDDVREQAVWALGNIAGDSPVCRDLVLSNGALTPLLQQLTESSKLTMLRNATWTLSNLCRGKPQPKFDTVSPALPILAKLIYSTDDEVLTDACWALSYLSDGSNDKIQAVLESGVARRMVELMMHSSFAVQTPALRTVGNVVTGDDLQTQVMLNVGCLPCLLALLSSPKKGIRKEACWTISNITAGNKSQIQAIVDAQIIPPLIQLLANAEFDIKKEAAWAISNATSGGNHEQIRYLVNQGCLRPLCDLLTCSDPRIISVALEGIENILRVGSKDAKATGTSNAYQVYIEECDGLDKIEALQSHQNNEIYEKAVRILETYFGAEEESFSNLAPQQDQNAFQFNPNGAPNQTTPWSF